MTSRRDFVRTIMLATGGIYTLELLGCKDGDRATVRTRKQQTSFDRQRVEIAHRLLQADRTLPAATRKRRADVVVVGSGMSGLSAAMQLRAEGLHAIVIESEPRAGGAAVSSNIQDVAVPLGSAYFVDRTPSMEEVLAFADVDPVVVKDDTVVLRGETYRDLWSDEQLRRAASSSEEADGMRRFRDAVLGMNDDLPRYPLADVLPRPMQELDAMSAASYVERFRAPLLTSILDAYTRSSMGASLNECNAHCLLNFYASEFGASFGSQRYSFIGGTASVASRMAAKLDVIADEFVLRVAQNSRGTTVYSMRPDGSVTEFQAGAVVMAIPKFAAARIVDGLETAQQQAMMALQYAPYLTVHISSSRPLLDGSAFDVWHIPASSSYTDVIDLSSLDNQPQQSYVASVYAPLPRADRTVALHEDSLAQRVGTIVRDVTAQLDAEAVEAVETIYCWAWGHGVIMPTVGSHTGIAQLARRDHGRVVFAGTDNDAAPALEHAVYHGIEAAKRTVAALRGSTS